jgi:hypothetical protein
MAPKYKTKSPCNYLALVKGVGMDSVRRHYQSSLIFRFEKWFFAPSEYNLIINNDLHCQKYQQNLDGMCTNW